MPDGRNVKGFFPLFGGQVQSGYADQRVSVVNPLRRLGTSRRVRDGFTTRELELSLG